MHDPDLDRQAPELEQSWERVRMARAERRLVEFELIERRVWLALTVALILISVVATVLGGLVVGAVPAAASLISGSAALLKSRDRRTQ